MAKVGAAPAAAEPLFRQLMPNNQRQRAPYYASPYEETLAYLDRLGGVSQTYSVNDLALRRTFFAAVSRVEA